MFSSDRPTADARAPHCANLLKIMRRNAPAPLILIKAAHHRFIRRIVPLRIIRSTIPGSP
jgi:hypothetical protein